MSNEVQTPDPSPDDGAPDYESLGVTHERGAEIRAQREPRLRMTKAQLIDELERYEILVESMHHRSEVLAESLIDTVRTISGQSGVPTDEPLAFPSHASGDSVRTTHPWRRRAWAGNSDRLIKLADIAEGCLKSHFEKHAAERQKQPLFKLNDAYRLKVEVQASRGRVRRSGPMRTVLAETEPSEIEAILIGNDKILASERHQPSLQVHLGQFQRYDYSGIDLEVGDDDADWVAVTKEKLASELQRHVPWWAPLRSATGKVAIYIVTLAMVIAIGLFPADHHGKIASWFVWVFYLAIFLPAGWVWVLNRYFLRPLEVLEPGRTTSAKRVVAAAIGLLSVIGACASVVALARK